jgi:signal transduction histidine kinase
VGTLIVGDDVTEKKIREDQLRQAQKLEGIGQLAAGIAHEINTPTQFVSDNITFVKDSWDSLSRLLEVVCKLNPAEPGTRSTRGGDNEILEVTEGMDLEYLRREIPRAIDETLEGLQRITKIVRAMKEFSHPGSSQKALTDINRAVQSTVTVASNEWKYVADLETDLDPGLPQVPCMVDKFNQVVLNLLINAVHAIAEATGNGSQGKGRILVKTRMVPGAVEISIADTGAGVPESIRDRIFELFFSTKEVGKGTGQGLALAHTTIVTEHNGKIWFESEVGKGTTFFVQLPLEAGRGEKSASAAGD